MTRPASLALLLVPLAALSAGPLRAQTDSLGTLHSAVAATPPMKRVRVEFLDGRRQEGTLYDPTASSIQLTDSTQASQPIAYGDVTRYWVQGRATGTGMITGATIGVASGALLGILGAAFSCIDGCIGGGSPPYLGYAVVGAALGGAVLGGVGALIGTAFPRYHLKWRAPN
jgi:hypothetical protein